MFSKSCSIFELLVVIFHFQKIFRRKFFEASSALGDLPAGPTTEWLPWQEGCLVNFLPPGPDASTLSTYGYHLYWEFIKDGEEGNKDESL